MVYVLSAIKKSGTAGWITASTFDYGRVSTVHVVIASVALEYPFCLFVLTLNPLSKAWAQTCVLMDAGQIHLHWATMETPLLSVLKVLADCWAAMI